MAHSRLLGSSWLVRTRGRGRPGAGPWCAPPSAGTNSASTMIFTRLVTTRHSNTVSRNIE